jgi:hypothetical protein
VPEPNDFLVTITSARLKPRFTELYSSAPICPEILRGDNHATIANPTIAVKTLDGIRAAQPVK